MPGMRHACIVAMPSDLLREIGRSRHDEISALVLPPVQYGMFHWVPSFSANLAYDLYDIRVINCFLSSYHCYGVTNTDDAYPIPFIFQPLSILCIFPKRISNVCVLKFETLQSHHFVPC